MVNIPWKSHTCGAQMIPINEFSSTRIQLSLMGENYCLFQYDKGATVCVGHVIDSGLFTSVHIVTACK